jgi:hypothetical protein
MMLISKQLITILTQHDARLWEKFFPHVPLVAHQGVVRSSALERVAVSPQPIPAAELNPQPLPPAEIFLDASADAARGMAQAAIIAEQMGASPHKALAKSIDDWCGTPPRPFPWPRPWPGPWVRGRDDDGPRREWDAASGQLVGAMTLASIAARMDEGEAQKAIEEAAEQLFGAATGE